MPDSELQQYDAFVTRTLLEVQTGLELDNHGKGSGKKRVHAALANRTTNATERSPAQKVIDGRFILGGDDTSYLANGLAMLWSTTGHTATSAQKEGFEELGLAPAALYSPDAVNGIRRGLLAAFKKKNDAMRKDAPNQLANLMGALVPILEFIYDGEGDTTDRDNMRSLLKTGAVISIADRNRLFKFLVRAKDAIDNQGGPDGKDIPASSLAFQILSKATEAHKTAMEAEKSARKADAELYAAELVAQKENCQIALDDCEERVNAARSTMQEWQAEHDALLEVYRREATNSMTSINGLQMELRDNELERGRMTRSYDENVARLTTEAGVVKAEVERLEREVRVSRDAVEGMKKRRNDDSAEAAEALRKATAKCESQKLKLDTLTLKEDELIRRHEEAVRDLTTQNAALAEANPLLIKRAAEDRATLQTTTKELAVQDRELARMRTRGRELEQDLRAKEQTLKGLRNNESALSVQLAFCRMEYRKMEAEHKKETKEATEKATEDCKKEIAKATEALNAWINQLNMQKQLAIVDKEKQRQAVQKEHEGELAEMARLYEVGKKKSEEEINVLRSEQTVLQTRNGELDKELKTTTANRNECEQKLRAYETQLETLGTAPVITSTQQTQEVAILRKEIAQCEEQLEALQREVASTRESAAQVAMELAAKEDEIVSLNANIAQKYMQRRTALEKKSEELEAKRQKDEEKQKQAQEIMQEAREKALANMQAVNKAQADCEQREQQKNEALQNIALHIAQMLAQQEADKEQYENAERQLSAQKEELEEELDAAKEAGADGEVANLRKERTELTDEKAEIASQLARVAHCIQILKEVQSGEASTSYDDDFNLNVSDDNDNNYVPLLTNAAAGNRWINTAVFRGLVGQRGPTEPANVAVCPHDALLPYALPKIDEVIKHMLPAHMLLAATPDPTDKDVDSAMAAFYAFERSDGAKRQRVDAGIVADLGSPAVTSEALALFQEDFAITGTTPAADLPTERCGVEVPHEVRWMPQGPRGYKMARVAVLEHAVARCGQLAAHPGVRPSVVAALRHAATALKLQQLAPLYELHEAVECDDDPHPLGTGATRLVTRPCAVVRGTLSFPSRPGVVPLTEECGGAQAATPFTQDALLAQAMGKTAAATATLRNGLRRQGLASNVYVAPEAHELAFRSAPTASDPAENRSSAWTAVNDSVISEASLESAPVTSDRVSSDMYRDETFRRIINRLLVCTAALKLGNNDDELEQDPVAAFLEVQKSPNDGAGIVTAQTRRQGLWAEMQRHVAVSQDRLWVFVRLMSGKIGGNASEVITLADEATLKAAKAIQEQRLEISKRVSDMQSKIVETVVASMLKNSKMTMDYKEDQLAVIDAEAEKNLKDLSTGASGRPFFEANVALKNLKERNETPPKLQDVLSGLANVGAQMQATLERTLAEPSAASASLVELSHPANSYFVMMRGDALTAIRAAQEKLNCELGVQGSRRRLTTWELVEGGCTVLTDRFAELCGYLLVQARTSTGVSAMYVSHQSIYTNTSQARVALARLVAASQAYLARVQLPAFDDDDPKEARFRALTQGEKVRDIDVTSRVMAHSRIAFNAPISQSGWSVVGGRRMT